MRFTSIAVVFSAVAAVAAQLTIQTPASVNQCEPVLLDFSGGTPPYIVSVQPQGNLAGTALVTFPTTSANSLTWNVALVANTLITLEIRDSTGATQASGPITVGAGSGDSSCLAGSASQGSTAAVGSTAASSAVVSVTSVTASTTVAAGATTTAAGLTTTAAGATTTAAGSTTTKAATTASVATASTTSSKSAGSKLQPIGLAGLLVFVGVAALI